MSYYFWIEMESGERLERLEWRGLTKRQAEIMYACTSRRSPSQIKRFGWEEAK